MRSGDRYNAVMDPTVQYLWKAHKSFMAKRSSDFSIVNKDLYSKYKESLSNEVKWDIVITNIPLIFEIVHKKWDERFDFSDLLQEGILGASLGVERYKEGAGSTLVTIIRVYTFKKVQEYIDTYSDRSVVQNTWAAQKERELKKEEFEEVFTEFSRIPAAKSTINSDEILDRIDDEPRESKSILDFIDLTFDHKVQDVFYSHYRNKRSKKIESFEDVCSKHNITKEEGIELAQIAHSTIKKYYNGLCKDTV